MGQLGKYFRKEEGSRISHWCPACKEMHSFWVDKHGWEFDGNLEQPTVKPSIKVSGKQSIVDDKGEWTGEWVRDKNGRALDLICHYILTKGVIHFQPDCTHSMRGQKVPLPELPPWLRDPA